MSTITSRLTRRPRELGFFFNDLAFIALVALLVGFVIVLLAW
jgi:hypothetical protein